MWDVSTGGLLHEYEAHSRRIWSVDFCAADPTLLASGSDDCAVKFWSTRSPGSVAQVGGGAARGWMRALLCRPSTPACHPHGWSPQRFHASLPYIRTPPPPLCQVETSANVCAVRWRPGSSHELAVGSADHCSYLYDLRNTSAPVRTFKGHRCAWWWWWGHVVNRVAACAWEHTMPSHLPKPTLPLLLAPPPCHRKAVSYVRFCSPTELVSASTDSTLRLWGADEAAAVPGGDASAASLGRALRVYEGHVNEKNFVGLAGGPGARQTGNNNTAQGGAGANMHAPPSTATPSNTRPRRSAASTCQPHPLPPHPPPAVDGDFLACGSETAQLFVYYKALSKPVAQQSFGAHDDGAEAQVRMVGRSWAGWGCRGCKAAGAGGQNKGCSRRMGRPAQLIATTSRAR